MSREDLASLLAQVSHDLSTERDESQTASRICALAVEVVDGCGHATLTVRGRRGRLVVAGATSPVAERLGEHQRTQGDGPTVDAFASAEPVVGLDLGREERWAGWRDLAVEQGVASVLALPMVSGARTQAVITLLGAEPGAWAGPAYDVALLYATHAAAALDAAKVITGLESALGTRHQIGVAQGVLMERHRLTTAGAFAVLQRYSSTRNERLADVAAQVVDDAEEAARRTD